MKRVVFVIFVLLTSCNDEQVQGELKTQLIDPNEITMGGYVHEKFSDEFLSRIKATTDIFEPIDGISHEQAVDMYKRDIDPESNLMIWEEMARAFTSFCQEGCQLLSRKKEVYKALLLASMFPEEDVFNQLEPQILTADDVKKLNALYTLTPQPIAVVQE